MPEPSVPRFHRAAWLQVPIISNNMSQSFHRCIAMRVSNTVCYMMLHTSTNAITDASVSAHKLPNVPYLQMRMVVMKNDFLLSSQGPLTDYHDHEFWSLAKAMSRRRLHAPAPASPGDFFSLCLGTVTQTTVCFRTFKIFILCSYPETWSLADPSAVNLL